VPETGERDWQPENAGVERGRGSGELACLIASRWIWDVAWDSWVAAKQETETYVALALVFALYCE